LTAVVAESGALQAITLAEYQGLQAGAAYVNQHGGILGHPVQLAEQNDNLSPTTAASLLEQDLSGGTAPNEVFAGTTSNETLAMVPILTQHKILSMQATVSNETINAQTHPYAFSLGPATTDAAATLAAAVKKSQPSAKTVGIVIGNDVNGTSLLTNERTALTALGFKVDVQTYDPTTTVDMTPQMEALKSDNPDVLVASGFGPVAGYILQARAKLGWAVPVVGDASFSANPLPTMVPKADLTGVSIATESDFLYKPLTQESQAYQTFDQLVTAQGANFSQNSVIYSIGYDVVILAQMAAGQAGSLDATAMSHALENIQQPTTPAYVTYPVEQFSSVKHSPILSADLAAVASPYVQNGLYLPVGQQPTS
jgi:branched-chain amino acid transport system substrate-binding protein